MISKDISKLIADSMKAGNFLRTETLRMLSSALNYERIALQRDLTEEDEISVVRKQAKQRKDSIEALRQAQGKTTTSSPEGIKSRIVQEEDELKILQEFLPPEMSDQDLIKLIDNAIKETGAKSLSEMGKVIGAVKSKAPNVDGGKIALLIKNKLSA